MASSAFQSTRPRGARPVYFSLSINPSNFNPRAREGRDLRHEILAVEFAISIHAPARGATRECLALCSSLAISIHAPARGATYRNVEKYS